MKYKPQSELSQDERDKRRARWREKWAAKKERVNAERRNPTRRNTPRTDHAGELYGLSYLTQSELEAPSFRIERGDSLEVEKWLKAPRAAENPENNAQRSPQSDIAEHPSVVAPPKLPPELL